MTLSPAPTRRTLGLLGSGLVAAALVTGCGARETATAPAAATGPATAAPAADTAGDDLAAGLLPASDFGEGATAMPVPLDRLGAMTAMAGPPPGLEVRQGQDCLTAVQALLPRLAAVDDAAVQVVRTDGPYAVEALARPPAPVDAPGELAALVAPCSSVEVAVDGHGSAQVAVTEVDVSSVPEQGDRAAAVAVTVTATGTDGRSWAGTALAGVVQDGDRVLALAQADPHGGAVSEPAFTELLRKAYQAQADALG